MYVTRNNKLYLAGFFSAKLRSRQVTWLPCEIEALSITAANTSALTSFSRKHQLVSSLTANLVYSPLKNYVKFSSSPHVATFLSNISRYQASVRHVAGAAMLPSDFASRNAPECDNPTCQVCSFIQHTEDSMVSPRICLKHTVRNC